jgi:hypothetical protein
MFCDYRCRRQCRHRIRRRYSGLYFRGERAYLTSIRWNKIFAIACPYYTLLLLYSEALIAYALYYDFLIECRWPAAPLPQLTT